MSVSGFKIQLQNVKNISVDSSKPNVFVKFTIGKSKITSSVKKKTNSPLFGELLFLQCNPRKLKPSELKLCAEVWTQKKKFLKKKVTFVGKFVLDFSKTSINDGEEIKIVDKNLERTTANTTISMTIKAFGISLNNSNKIVSEVKKDVDPKKIKNRGDFLEQVAEVSTPKKVQSTQNSQYDIGKKSENSQRSQKNNMVYSDDSFITTSSKTNEKKDPSFSNFGKAQNILKNNFSHVSTPTGFNTDSSIFNTQDNEKEDEKDYDILKKCGSGGFGDVYLIQMRKTNKLKALKKVYCKTQKEVNKSMREVFVLKDIVHPNIINYDDIFFEEITSGPFKYAICFTMDYYNLGDLDNFLLKRSRTHVPLKETLIISFMLQLAKAIQYIHGKKIIHRDLKPANVFMANNYKELVIADFGLVKDISGPQNSVTLSKCGTPKFVSPEVYTSNSTPGIESDIWSLGCIFYNMMALQLDKIFYMEVYKNKDFHDWIRKVLGKTYCSQLVEIVVGCLKAEPKERISVNEIINALSDLSNGKVEKTVIKVEKKIEEVPKENVVNTNSSNINVNPNVNVNANVQMMMMMKDPKYSEMIQKTYAHLQKQESDAKEAKVVIAKCKEEFKTIMSEMKGYDEIEAEMRELMKWDESVFKKFTIDEFKKAFHKKEWAENWRNNNRYYAMFNSMKKTVETYLTKTVKTVINAYKFDQMMKGLDMQTQAKYVEMTWNSVKNAIKARNNAIETYVVQMKKYVKMVQDSYDGIVKIENEMCKRLNIEVVQVMETPK